MQHQVELEKNPIRTRKIRKRRPRAWKKIWIRKIKIRYCKNEKKSVMNEKKERELNFELDKHSRTFLY